MGGEGWWECQDRRGQGIWMVKEAGLTRAENAHGDVEARLASNHTADVRAGALRLPLSPMYVVGANESSLARYSSPGNNPISASTTSN